MTKNSQVVLDIKHHYIQEQVTLGNISPLNIVQQVR